MSKLIIEEPPLQVLPSLAIKIGLNEAIVLQQLHYLLRDPRFGRKIAEEQWIFNTAEQWRCQYFPFWSEQTIMRAFKNLKDMSLIETCQPEGRISRRTYYRINLPELERISESINLIASKVSKRCLGKTSSCPLPLTKTTAETSSSKTTLSKETKETAPVGAVANSEEEFDPRWKPDSRSRDEKLRTIRVPKIYPSEREFDAWLEEAEADQILSARSDLYSDLSDRKWHHWNEGSQKWTRIVHWQKYVCALNDKMEEARSR